MEENKNPESQGSGMAAGDALTTDPQPQRKKTPLEEKIDELNETKKKERDAE